MTDEEANTKRCIANEIILELFHARKTGQVQLLLMACTLSAKQLDPEGHREFVRHQSTMHKPATPPERTTQP